MPPPLPERFRLEVRLGRDDDLEEWLATDTSLDRPVLIRFLGPESTIERRAQFVRAVRAAAAVSHPHLASVYQVDQIDDGAFSVSEWTGGATLASRLGAGDTIEPEEFLPNASGLTSALAALHDQGVTHGGIDTEAVTYTVSHPAKLGAFGRPVLAATTTEDVAALARTLEVGLTGSPPGGPPPSESIDGLSPVVDKILRAGERGSMSARALSEAFATAPTPRRPQPESTRPSRRLLFVAIALVLAAAALVGLGRVFTPSGIPMLPPPAPVAQSGSTSTSMASTTTTVTVPTDGADVLDVGSPATLDPFGGGGENDGEVEGLVDGDLSTSWRTELYLDPLPLLKAGVGVTVEVDGTPSGLDLLGLSPGAVVELAWAEEAGDVPGDYDVVARLVSQPGASSIQLPARDGGTWLVWFTDLPQVGDTYSASISEVRFRP
jgi:hypothetical protein